MLMRVPTATIRTQVSVPLQLADGYTTEARVFSFDGLVDGREHLTFGLGDLAGARPPGGYERIPLVRPHSECLTGDVFGSERCDCGPQLREAVERIADSGGFLLYLRQEGRGIGLYAKLEAYALQDKGYDTVDANVAIGAPIEARDYDLAAHILFDLGYPEIKLLTNNPAKVEALREEGLEVIEQLPLIVKASPHNKRYLATKKERMAHKL